MIHSPELFGHQSGTANIAESVAQPVISIDEVNGGEVVAPQQVKDRLDAMTDRDFQDWLLHINGTLRQVEPQRRSFDGKGVIGKTEICMYGEIDITEYTPPEPEDRLPLLMEAFHTAQRVRRPETAGAILDLAISYTHVFADANGRTGRYIQAQLARGFDGSLEMHQYYDTLLTNETGREHADLRPQDAAPQLLYEYAEDKKRILAQATSYDGPLPNSTKNMTFMEHRFWPAVNPFDKDYWIENQQLLPDVRAGVKEVMNGRPAELRDVAVFEWLLETGKANEDTISYSEYKERPFIAYGDIFQEGICEQDAARMIASYRAARRGFVRYAIEAAVQMYEV